MSIIDFLSGRRRDAAAAPVSDLKRDPDRYLASRRARLDEYIELYGEDSSLVSGEREHIRYLEAEAAARKAA